MYCGWTASFTGRGANLNHFADIQTDRKRNLVAALAGVPVNKHVRRSSDTPSIAREVDEKILNIHLAHSLRPWAASREPLLRKYSGQPFVTEVAEYAGGSYLPFVLAEPRVARGRENETRAYSQQPRTGKLRAGREQSREDCVAESGDAMQIAALVQVRRGVHHLKDGTSDQIPIVGQSEQAAPAETGDLQHCGRACSASRYFPEAEVPRCSKSDSTVVY